MSVSETVPEKDFFGRAITDPSARVAQEAQLKVGFWNLWAVDAAHLAWVPIVEPTEGLQVDFRQSHAGCRHIHLAFTGGVQLVVSPHSVERISAAKALFAGRDEMTQLTTRRFKLWQESVDDEDEDGAESRNTTSLAASTLSLARSSIQDTVSMAHSSIQSNLYPDRTAISTPDQEHTSKAHVSDPSLMTAGDVSENDVPASAIADTGSASVGTEGSTPKNVSWTAGHQNEQDREPCQQIDTVAQMMKLQRQISVICVNQTEVPLLVTVRIPAKPHEGCVELEEHPVADDDGYYTCATAVIGGFDSSRGTTSPEQQEVSGTAPLQSCIVGFCGVNAHRRCHHDQVIPCPTPLACRCAC